MTTAGLFLDYLKTYLKTRLTYRSDFWVEVFSDLLFLAMNLIFIVVIFEHTQLLDGWTREQIIFVYGYFMVPWGVFSAMFNLWGFTERYIVKGEMDRVLTRPVHNLAQLMLENMDPSALISAVIGVAIMGYAWPSLGVTLDWYDPLVFVLLVLGSVMIYGGIYISLTALSFFSDSPTGILPLMWNIQSYGRYPITIYNKILQLVLTWALPFAFVGFYPAAFFLEAEEMIGYALLTPIVGAAFLAIGLFVWNTGVKRYRGAGS
ncbi:ABC transporter permease [Paenibacillus sp.]|uniref:ABC transporter permease n=1 Tax=Paenibacillus sp. TaxID=58172 RepID=UPI002D313BB3|nr:ABC-2 family transporter protein [Paenibacillus sp.]HZG83510.1 ABC-2 family transporter protein [Paenibacillus sp.]